MLDDMCFFRNGDVKFRIIKLKTVSYLKFYSRFCTFMQKPPKGLDLSSNWRLIFDY